MLYQPYVQMRYRASTRVTLTGGLHSMIFALNGSKSLEPRLSVAYQLTEKASLTAAYGLHSQVLPIGTYFTEVKVGNLTSQPNVNLGFVKAQHLVLAFNQVFGENYRLKLEPYYQSLYNVPVAADSSVYTPLNDRDGYAKVALSNGGKGYNRGVDLTLEKFFANRFFFLLGGSVYESKYKMLDGKWYNSRYNGNFNTSLMAGKEWMLKNKNVIELGGRMVFAGGLRYGIDTTTWTPNVQTNYPNKLKNVARLDLRLAYRMSGKRSSSVVSLDVQNASNRLNYTDGRQCYTDLAANKSYLYFKQQATLTPIITYMIDF
jgi:TonB dependent receptor